MKITSIAAQNFLSFRDMKLDLGPGLTVVTGPNAAGKSNLCQALKLVSAFLDRHRDQAVRDRLALYEEAGHHGATAFSVSVGWELDQPWEQALVTAFVKAAYITLGRQEGTASGPSVEAFERAAEASITTASLTPLHRGTLRLDFDARRRPGWSCAWQFTHDDQLFHLQLEGPYGQELRPGPAQGWQIRQAERVVTLAGFVSPVQAAAGPPTPPPEVDFPQVLDQLKQREQPISLHVPSLNEGSGPLPVCISELADALVRPVDRQAVNFDAVLGKIWLDSVTVTDNRRLPPRRRYTLEELVTRPSLDDGGHVTAELYRLKNGTRPCREQYRRAQQLFHALTSAALDVQATVTADSVIIDVLVDDGHSERRMEFLGAGYQEVVLLATLTAGNPGSVNVLDEPAVHLHPTLQRRIAKHTLREGQGILVTHSPDLVPIDTTDDLQRIVRLAPGSGRATQVHRVAADTAAGLSGWIRNLAAADTRALLFARAVILCEGATEVGALSRWWNEGSRNGPEAANVPLLDVGGQNNFGGYINYLTAFGIPWAVIADGPALRDSSGLRKQLAKQQRLPDDCPGDRDDFPAWQTYWSGAGVFTLADSFGDDGTKSGEIEAYLKRLNPGLLDQVRTQTTSKPQVGALFATNFGTMPPRVAALYDEIALHLNLGQAAESTGAQ